MDEMYRMLGREHEADLEREALKWRRASVLPKGRGADAATPHGGRLQKGRPFVLGRVLALIGRGSRAEA